MARPVRICLTAPAEERARRDSQRSLSTYSSALDTGKTAEIAAKSYGEAILGGARFAATDAFLPDAYRQILSVNGMATSLSAMQQSYRTDPFASIGHGADLANELIPRSGTGSALSGVLTAGATSMVINQSRAIMAQLEHDLDQIVIDTNMKANSAISFSPVKTVQQDSLTDQLNIATDRAGQMYSERGAASSAAMQRVAAERAAQRAAEAAVAEAEARRQEDLRLQEEYAAEQQRYYEEQQRQMALDYQRQQNAALADQIFSGIISGLAAAQSADYQSHQNTSSTGNTGQNSEDTVGSGGRSIRCSHRANVTCGIP